MADVTKILKLITLNLYDKLAKRVSDKLNNIELTPGPQGPVGATGAKGETGDRGPQGYTFTPKVDANGNLSWSNNGGLSNPSAVNIKGPQGEKGNTGDTGPQGVTGAQGPIGSQGPRGRGAATKVVGTTQSGHTTADCDFLCDGTADNVEIQNAINALPSSGGKVILLEGTYNTTANITMSKSNVTVCGMGAATIIKRSQKYEPMISLHAANCKICDFVVDGNFDSFYTSGFPISVKIRASYCTVSDMEIKDGGQGIYFDGSASYTLISHNQITSCSGNAILAPSSSTPALIIGNYISAGVYGVESAVGASVIGNIFDSCNAGVHSKGGCNICGNTFLNMTKDCMRIEGSYSTINGNNCDTGITVTGSNNIIVGNNLHGQEITDSGSNNIKANNQ